MAERMCRGITLGVVVAHAAALAAGPTTRLYPDGPRPSLVIAKPYGWIEQIIGAQPGIVSLQFAAREPVGAVSAKFMFRADPPARPTDDARVRDFVTELAQMYVDQSVERRIELRPLGAGQDGYAVTLTDVDPPARNKGYACVTVVGRRLGDGLLVGTIFHPKDSTNLQRAFELVRTATAPNATTHPTTLPAATTQAAPIAGRPTTLRLTSPDGTWAVAVDLPRPIIDAPRRPGTTAAANYTAVQTDDGYECSVTIDPAQTPGDAKAARDFMFEQRVRPIARTGRFTLSGDGRRGTLAYTTGGPDRQVLAVLVRDGKWAVVQIGTPFGTNADQLDMVRILKTARIEPTTRPTTNPTPATRPTVP